MKNQTEVLKGSELCSYFCSLIKSMPVSCTRIIPKSDLLFLLIPSPAPEAPHISSVDYSHGVLYVRWTYGELFIDMSHSRMMHWQVVAMGKKGPKKSYTVDVSPFFVSVDSFICLWLLLPTD